MKLVSLLESWLDGQRAPLYHFTEHLSAIRIVGMNALGASVKYDNPATFEGPHIVPGSISFTRDKKYRVRGKNTDTCFMLDAEKVRSKFKIKPVVDYFVQYQKDYPGNYRNEAEEYVNGVIQPLDNYLLKIYIDREAYLDLKDSIEIFKGYKENAKYGKFRKSPEMKPKHQVTNPKDVKRSEQYYDKFIKEYQRLLNHPKLTVGLP